MRVLLDEGREGSAAVKEQIEWIACADRMPAERDIVLGYAPIGADDYELFVGVFEVIEGVGWWDNGDVVFRPDQVTHWARLPNGPRTE